MKYILTNKDNEIIEISNTYEIDEEHRNIIVDDHAIAYAPDEVINVYEVEEIPTEVEIAKYCYTEEKGFYINENYVEPKPEITNEELMQQITNLQLALAEVIEGGI